MKTKLLYNVLLSLMISFGSLELGAQTSQRKYQKCLKLGDEYHEHFMYRKSIQFYEKAVHHAEGEEKEYPTLQIADSYRQINEPERAVEWYGKLENSEALDVDHKHHYAQMLLKTGDVEKAHEIADDLAVVEIDRLKVKDKTRFHLDSNAYFLERVNINSEDLDFGVAFYKDGIVFASNKKNTSLLTAKHYWDNSYFLDLYYSKLSESGEMTDPEPFAGNINTTLHEGPSTFYDDYSKMIFTRNNFHQGRPRKSEEGVNMLQLYYTERKENKKWSKPVPLSFNSDHYSTGHPSITPDGSRLYFASDMPGTLGKADIFYSDWKDGEWSTPINLGPEINGPEDELFPFIADNGDLYFSSLGHEGLGGLDIYRAKWVNDKAKVINLGYPINTLKDDFGLIVRNNFGYLSSNRDGGEGKDDIYRFKLYEDIVQAMVIDAESGETLGLADIDIADNTNEYALSANERGRFSFPIKRGSKSTVLASLDGYTSKSEVISYSELARDGFIPEDFILKLPLSRERSDAGGTFTGDILKTPGDILLLSQLGDLCHYKDLGHQSYFLCNQDRIELCEDLGANPTIEEITNCLLKNGFQLGEGFDVENIYFDYDEAVIRSTEHDKLDHIIDLMTSYSFLALEVSSHTDSRASDEYNDKLSERRSKATTTYLLNRGITTDRLNIDYYGEARLINNCGDEKDCSEEEHQINRRTEFKFKIKESGQLITEK